MLKYASHMDDRLKISEDHFQRLARLLDLEAEAEKQETVRSLEKMSPAEAEASGNSLIQLVIREEDSGLGGKILLTFGKRNENLHLPWSRIGNGSPVILSEEGLHDKDAPSWRGIVSRANKDTIQVAFTHWPETDSDRPTFRLDRSTDEISRQRQRLALESSRGAKGTRLAILRDVLLGKQNPVFNKIEVPIPCNNKLNNSQNQAVAFALSAEDVAIIHGPPGTGKTTTLIELMRQITHNGQTMLAVAASNLAVDNMLERLIDAGENAIRLGHPARVSPVLREHTLDELTEVHPDMKLARKLTRDAHSLRKQASKYFRVKPDPNLRQSLREEAKQLLNEARQIEDSVTERIINNAKIVCATATGLDSETFARRKFDWCIMDEASQSVEPSAWIPVQYANRLVLAGDHFQLPPTVISPEAIRGGFNISLMERLLNINSGVSRLLNVQYRMHQDIMNFSSDVFYEGSLQADETVRTALLTDLPNLKSSPLTDCPIHFIDTAGASYDEEQEADGDSRLNPLEAELVIKKVHELLSCGLSPKHIAVISPYSAQVKLLREKLKHLDLEIDSVDGFQGREKEAVIVSLVRSNREGEVGFLADTRRMNVALTRARRKLIVIGDSATITSHGFYQRMVEYFESIGAYHSVWEE
ncbi:MAG: IGHMBP2 family helicase [Chloroflexi bacterium]|nr:IGHMBP2 family helicase [Chloroflexota bacterium]